MKITAEPNARAPRLGKTGERKTTRAEQRAVAERKLLGAARDIVAAKGCVGMTLADVGEAAGYSRGLAAHHFGSKGGLLRALADHLDDNLKALIRNAPARRDGIDALLGFVATYLGRKGSQWTNTRALLLLMAEAMIDGSGMGDHVTQYNERVAGFLEAHVQAGIAAGEIRPEVSPKVIASLIVGALRGVMLQKLNGDAKLDLREVLDQLVELLIRGIATERGAAIIAAAAADAPTARRSLASGAAATSNRSAAIAAGARPRRKAQ